MPGVLRPPLSMTSAAYRSLAHSKAGGGLMNVKTMERRIRLIWPAALPLPYARHAAFLRLAATTPTVSVRTATLTVPRGVLLLLRGAPIAEGASQASR